MTRKSWKDYDPIGDKLANRLRKRWSEPQDFVEHCVELAKEEKRNNSDDLQPDNSDELKTWIAIRPVLLEDVDGIGNDISGIIVDQMVEDLVDRDSLGWN